MSRCTRTSYSQLYTPAVEAGQGVALPLCVYVVSRLQLPVKGVAIV